MSLRTLPDGKQIFALPAAWNERFRVTVIGCGGTGSEMVDALMRLHHVLRHFGHPTGIKLELWDGDTVSPSNVGRQRFLSADVGKNKAEVLARRYGVLYGVDIAVNTRAMQGRDFSRLQQDDLVITCVDRVAIRLALAEWARRTDLPQWERCHPGTLWLDLGNGSHTGQCVLGHLNDAAPDRLPNIASLYGQQLAQVDDRDEPSCSLEAALTAQRLGINRLLVDAAVFSVLSPLFMLGSVDVHGAFVDLAKASVRPIRIGAESWSFFGHTRPAVAPAKAPNAQVDGPFGPKENSNG